MGKIASQVFIESLPIGRLGVAAVSFWEAAMLIEKRRSTTQEFSLVTADEKFFYGSHFIKKVKLRL